MVVGRDGRHSVAEFAEDAAAVLARRGIAVPYCRRPVPTPLLAFALQRPRRGGGGHGHRQPQPGRRQRLQGLLGERRPDHPALDAGIAAAHRRARAAGAARRSPTAGSALPRRPGREVAGRTWTPSRSTAGVHRGRPATARSPSSTRRCTAWRARSLRRLAARASRRSTGARAGRARRDFPTVAFPNPEEKGAMDLALALARSSRRAGARQRSRRRPPRGGRPTRRAGG